MKTLGYLTMAIFASACAADEPPVVSLDFEPGSAGYALHMKAELLGADGKPIAGRQSVVGDSRGKGYAWYEFLSTTAGPLTPGHVYEATFRYRVDYAAADAYLYGLYRSKSRGWGKTDAGWTNFRNLAASAGRAQTAVVTAGLDHLDDYELLIGIHGDARVVIDDVTIRRGKAYRAPTEEEKALASIPATAKVLATLDFEKDPPKNVALQEFGRIAPEGALAGKRGLLADSLKAPGTWNNVLWVSEWFAPGYTYHLTLRYRTLDAGEGKAAGYVLLRSKKHGHGEHDRGWRQWSLRDEKASLIYQRIEVPDGDDYYLILGLKGKAKMAVDDIVIRREPLVRKPIATRQPMVRTDANLVWRDEFDGKTLDAARWNTLGDHRRRGGWWLKKHAYLDGKGHLVLRFDRHGDTYGMGAVNTEGRFEFTYGYVEARMQNPKQEGHWPGVWLFGRGVNRVGDDGRDGTEVDIVECPWRKDDRVSHALHWDGYGDDHRSESHTPRVPGINEGWHTYGVEWSPDGYIFFVDGKETWRSAAGGVCENPLYIILSDEQGGWSGDPGKAALPDYTLIDYVRVWRDPAWVAADAKRAATRPAAKKADR